MDSPGIIFNNELYFNRDPSNLGINVFSAKTMISEKSVDSRRLYVIDTEDAAWEVSYKNGSYKAYKDDEIDVPIIDIAVSLDRNNTCILTREGDIFISTYSQTEYRQLNLGTKFKSIHSGFRHELIAIDVNGNLWSNGIPLEEKKKDVGTNLIQYTKNIVFIQAEFGADNLTCLDVEGNIYVLGDTSAHDLLSFGGDTDVFKKVSSPIKFRKISKAFVYTALIDVNDNLWICGRYFGLKENTGSNFRDYFKLKYYLPNVKDIAVSDDYILVQLFDNSLMISSTKPWPDRENFIEGEFTAIEAMKADKLFNVMNKEKRFNRTKSAMK